MLPQTALHKAIIGLRDLSALELEAYIQYIENYSLPLPSTLSSRCREACNNARSFSRQDQITLYFVGKLLFDALKPYPKGMDRRLGEALHSKGHIQAKKINRDYYLYLRYWESGGGYDRSERRLVSQYIGYKTLARELRRGNISQQELLDAFYADNPEEAFTQLEKRFYDGGDSS